MGAGGSFGGGIFVDSAVIDRRYNCLAGRYGRGVA